MIEVNVLAVLVAAFVNMVLGMAWYSKKMFMDAWVKEGDVDTKHMSAGGKKMALIMFAAVAASVLTAYVLAYVAELAQIVGAGNALTVAFLVWLGFFATAALDRQLWEMKSMKLWFIQAGFRLVALLAMGAVIQLMG